MTHLRFAVLGDTHFCCWENHDSQRPIGPKGMPGTGLLDYFRYANMQPPVLRRLTDDIRQQAPHMLFSTGDIIEGNGGNLPLEDSLARKLLTSSCPVFHAARGSHDLKIPGKITYQHIHIPMENGQSSFILLDYTDWNDTQRQWLLDQLDSAASVSQRIFVFGHCPIFLLGRHFFDSEPFRSDVEEILSRYPVDVYFCGHTHNQTASVHANNMLQLCGSSVGYEHSPDRPLTELHAIPDNLKDAYIWGIPEDFSPAYLLVDVDDSTNNQKMTITRMTLNGQSGKLSVNGRLTKPEVLAEPNYQHLCTPFSDSDFMQIRAAWLNLFSVGNHEASFSLNGENIGFHILGTSYEARHIMPLTPEAVCSLKRSNVLKVTLPLNVPSAVGSMSLTLVLLDGRIVTSQVSPEKYCTHNTGSFAFGARSAAIVAPGSTVTFTLTLS